MATAKKLPSGSWRVRIYSHTDFNGKKVYESFTAPTKREAEFLASEWVNRKDRHKRSDLTVIEAIEGYINAKSGVLSPSTIRGYDKMYRNNYKSIAKKPIKKLTTETLQLFVSKLAQELSPKSVSNIYGLLSSSLSFYMPDTVFRVTLPHKIKKKITSPTNEDVNYLFNSASKELQKCIVLSAFGSLRRGEICALTFSDLNGDILTVDKDIVQDKNKNWILKKFPKTDASVREAVLPDKVVKLLGTGEKTDKIVKYKNPGSITGCFTKLRNRTGVNICFHQLRHYYASIGAILGIPKLYLEEYGGWVHGGQGNVMESVYQNKIVSMSEAYQKKMKKYFDDVI